MSLRLVFSLDSSTKLIALSFPHSRSVRSRIAYDYEGRNDPYHLRSTRYGKDFTDEDSEGQSEDDGNIDVKDEIDAGTTDVGSTSNAGRGTDGDVEMGEAGAGPSTAKSVLSEAGGADKVDVGGAIQQQRTMTAKLR